MFTLFFAILIHLTTLSGGTHTVHAPAMHAMDSSGGPMPSATPTP